MATTSVKHKKVVVVEDNAGLREELLSLLKQAPDLDCIYAVTSAEEALQRIPQEPPDVILMDIQLPGMSGIECVSILKKQIPSLEVVMLTIYQDEDSIFRALKAGASGYLIKSSDPDALFAAIRDVYAGGAPFSSLIARKVVHYFHEGENKGKRLLKNDDNLSPREIEVLDLMAAGYRYKEIAKSLGVSLETVRTHVKHVCGKMHVRSRAQALSKLLASDQ